MKRLLKVFTALLLVFIIGFSGLYLWQRDNINSVLVGIYENEEEIVIQRNTNQENLVLEINEYMDVPVRELSEEEKQKIESGEVSATDVYQELFETNTVENPEKTETKSDKDSIISKYMAQLYNLQNVYTGKAEALISQGASYYENLKKSDGAVSARASTITHFTPIVRGLESECDAKVEGIIKNLTGELKAIGADTSIIASIRATYSKEKQLKLSYYANKYLH